MENTSKSMMKKKYFIIFICMFMQAIPFGVAQNIQPLFVPHVIKEFGFSLASFSLIFTIGALASAAFAPFLGKLFGKIPIKFIFVIGTTISSLGFLLFGFAKNLPMFYLFSAITQIGCVFFSSLGVPFVINNWFPKTGRGKALGLAFSGGSIGNVFLQQITSNLLANQGVSASYIILGIASSLLSLPVILLFIRLPKEEEIPYLEVSVAKSKKEATQPIEGLEAEQNISPIKEGEEADDTFEGMGVDGVKKSKYFWIFGIGYAIIGVTIAALSTQYATYFTGELNYSSALVGTLGSAYAIFCLIGNVSGGILFDRLRTVKAMFIAMILEIISIVGMLLAPQNTMFAFLFSIAYGLAVYCYMSGPSFMATDIFGKKDSAVILGMVSLFFMVGFASGSTLFGMIVDNFGFNLAWFSMIGFIVVGYAMLLFAANKVTQQNKTMSGKHA